MFRRLSEQDFYQVLDVGYDASATEIQCAYEEAREIYSREALVSVSILTDQERRRIFDRIVEAYNTLIAEESRRLYDETLGIARRGSSWARPPAPPRKTTPGAPAGEERARPEAVETAPPSTDEPASERSESDEATRAPRASGEPRRSPLQLGLTEEATGEFLRRCREALGLDLATIAAETKIGCSMLEYIENERLDRLPAPVYLRNFTLQIARCLGLDEEKVSRTYLSRIRRLQSHG